MSVTEEASALVVPVPAAEPVVGPHRLRADPMARLGMPAHVTVLAPFLAPSRVDEATVALLARVVGATPAFSFSLAGVGWFGRRVAYLVPVPSRPFVELTESVCAAFPGLEPYGGAFDEVVPHLTLGEGGRRVLALWRAARAVRPSLPVAATASEVWLMTTGGDGPSWGCRARLALGVR